MDVTEISKQERDWGLFCHLAALAVFVIPFGFGGVTGPLIIWLIKRDEFPFVNDQGKESLNFQITLFICGAVIGVLGIGAFMAFAIFPGICHPAESPLIGLVAYFGMFVALGLLAILDVIAIIVAAVRSSKGERFRYPVAIRFIK